MPGFACANGFRACPVRSSHSSEAEPITTPSLKPHLLAAIGPRGESHWFCSALDSCDGLSLWRAQAILAAEVWTDGAALCLSIGPAQIDLESSPRAQAADRALWTRRRKRGQQIN